jgi:hypothetical protein
VGAESGADSRQRIMGFENVEGKKEKVTVLDSEQFYTDSFDTRVPNANA